MKIEDHESVSRRTILWTLSLVLVAFALYLLWSHYVKAYSDPVHYLRGAQKLAEGKFPSRKPPLYYLFLLVNLKILGPVYIFLVNGPLLVLMAWLVYRVTGQLFHPEVRGGLPEGPDPRVAAMAALLILIATNLTFYLDLLNPYREPLAYCFLLAGVSLLLSFAAGGGPWLAAFGALFVGLSVGVRETCAVMLVPVALFFLYGVFTQKEGPRWKSATLFIFFLAVGLSPFLFYNYLYSGHVAVPSYAATKWLAATGDNMKLPRDIPVPGMSLHFFKKTGSEMLRLHWAKYGWWGGLLLVAGLAASWRRSLAAVWWLLLPSIAINMVFFSFWHRRMWRFYTVIDLFLVPILAVGFAALLGRLSAFLASSRPGVGGRLTSVAASLLAAATLVVLAVGAGGRGETFKVWHVDEVRRFILPHLEKPFSVLGDDPANEMLSWILRAEPDGDEYRISRKRVREAGLDEALQGRGRRSLEASRQVNRYVYRKNAYPVLEQWFDLEEVLSLADLPVPFEKYGKRIDGTIYGVRPWKEEVLRFTLPLPEGGGPGLLKVDAHRIWDYRGRSVCRLYVDGRLAEERVPNGVHFLPLPEGAAAGGSMEIEVRSDAPLPARIMAEFTPLNGEMTIPFGLRAGGGWYYPYASAELLAVAPLRRKAFYLREEGSLTLPKFCDTRHDMMAEFTVEPTTWRPDRKEVREVTADAGYGAARMPLAPRGVATRFAVSLGPGTGALELVDLDLSFRTTDGSRRSYARISGVRLFPVPRVFPERLKIDVGSEEDRPYLLEGFHPPGRYRGAVPVRWTDGRGRLRLPLRKSAEWRVTVTVAGAGPPGREGEPAFAVNGRPVPEDGVQVDAGEGGLRTYSFSWPGRYLKGEGMDLLEIESTPWVPLEHGLGEDNRSLGALVDSVAVETR